jgi:hypothetical protein
MMYDKDIDFRLAREGDEYEVTRACVAERALNRAERTPGCRHIVEDNDEPARHAPGVGDRKSTAHVFFTRGVLGK